MKAPKTVTSHQVTPRSALAPSDQRPVEQAHPGELHRLCVFDLDLTCGHRVTVSVNGWYPVWVACCDRLGGTWFDGTYIPYSSTVDFVPRSEQRYERRPPGAAREPLRILHRRDRTDEPTPGDYAFSSPHSGRFPARVGAPAAPSHGHQSMPVNAGEG